jgi:esterase/lipase
MTEQEQTTRTNQKTALAKAFLSAAVAALLLAACNNSSTEDTKEVTQARAEAYEDVSETRQDAGQRESEALQKVNSARSDYAETNANAYADLTKIESEAMITNASADFDIAMSEAEGRRNIAMKKCNSLEGMDKTACQGKASAKFDADEASAITDRDTALAAADNHQ